MCYDLLIFLLSVPPACAILIFYLDFLAPCKVVRTCMSEEEKQLEEENSDLITTNGLLTELLKSEKQSHQEKSGLLEYTGLLIEEPRQYQALPPDLYKSLTQELKIHASLPRAPTLGEYSFLLSKKGSEIKELFEDVWATASLNYSAACEVYVQLVKATKDGKLEETDPIFEVARRSLLCASNVPARALQVYKYLAKRQAVKTVQKPGNNRSLILSEEEAKSFNTSIDTAAKLQKRTHPKPIRGSFNSSTYWNFSYYPGVYRGRRGRGRGRRGRRGRGRGRPQPGRQ